MHVYTATKHITHSRQPSKSAVTSKQAADNIGTYASTAFLPSQASELFWWSLQADVAEQIVNSENIVRRVVRRDLVCSQ